MDFRVTPTGKPGHKRTLDSFAELSIKDIPSIEYLVEPIIPRKGITYLYGPPGSFKTNFAIYTAVLGAYGKDVFGFPVKRPFSTFFVDEENREIGMKEKIVKISKGLGLKPPENCYVETKRNFSIIDEACLRWLEECMDYKVDWVVFDSISKIFPLDERNEQDVKKIYKSITPFITKYGIAFTPIHHTRKRAEGQYSRHMEDLSGSREFSASADSLIQIEQKKDVYLLKQTKNRYSAQVKAINFTVSGNGADISLYFQGEAEQNMLSKAREAILRWAEDEGKRPFKTKELTDDLDGSINKTQIEKSLKSFVDDKRLDRKSKGNYEWIP
jgi:RecA-family ATPase